MVLATLAGDALAEDARVHLEVVGPAGSTTLFEEPVASALSRLPVAIEVHGGGELDVRGLLRLPPSVALARIWIDASDEDRFSMFLADASGERLLVRHVPRTGVRDVVARDEICQIVESSIEALLGGGTIGVSRAQAAEALLPAPAPPAPRPPAPSVRAPPAVATRSHAESSGGDAPGQVASAAGVFAGWHLAGWSNSVRLHGPAVGAHWFHPLGDFGWGIAATAELRFPRVVSGALVGMRVGAVSLRAVPRLAYQLGPGVRAHLGVGPGIDFIESGPVAVTGSAAALGPTEAYSTGVLRAELGVDLRPFEAASLLLCMAADVDATQTRYTARVDDARREVFVSWRAHPVLTATLTVDLLQHGRR